MLLTTSLIIIMLTNIVMIISLILSKKKFLDREKSSPFECGFDPKSSARLPFSLHFFLITVMFLIFDVEITLILPMIMIYNFSNMISWLISSFSFIMILLIGLFHEWNQGMLNWSL
uniref:NADH dehydrogenase subunit 3 n=1 Tax=Agapetus zniachtl TaxID=1875106 RepID=UPI0022DCE2AC|nr:NADH dehydrogenase subunit 3 [Agapetus zniachtl]UZZ43733.1 NADH dehydrogenase subunit 3 [Agapetus zniachtl]